MQETFDWLWRLAFAECLFAAWGYAAFAVAIRLLPSSGIALRWTAAGVVGLWLLSIAFHLLLALSSFTLLWATVMTLAATLVAFATCGGSAPLRRAADDLAYARQLLPWQVQPVLFRLAAFAAAFVALVVALRAMMLPVVAWDSLTYHAVKSAMWVQRGGPIDLVTPGGFSIYRDYPGGGELLHAWAMLPLRSDLLTGVVDAVTWLLLGVAVHALGAQFGLSAKARWTGAAYVLAIPAVARAAGSLYVDNLLALTLVAACALTLHALRRGGAGSLVLACMALGLGVGIKIFALPVAALVLPAVFMIAMSRPGPLRTFTASAAGGAAFLAAAGPWFLGNWLRTGYPMSPFPVEAAGITLGRAGPSLLWYMDRPSTAGAGLGDELRALAETFGVPGTTPLSEPTLGVVSLIVMLVAAVAMARLAKRDWRAAVVTLAFGVPMLASYYGEGLKNTRLIWASVSGRYLLAAVALGVVLSLACCRGRGAWQRGYGALLGTAAGSYFLFSNIHGWTGAEAFSAVAAAIVLIGLGALWPRIPPQAARVALPALLLLGAGLLGIYRDATRDEGLRNSVALHASPRYWVPALDAVDDPSQPRTLAVAAGASQDNDNWMLYPFLGQRLQNTLVYVPVTADGTVIDLAANEERVARSDFGAWHRRLAEQSVTHVISFSPQSLELLWMERDPAIFRRLAGDGRHWGLYQLSGVAPGG